VKDLSQLWNEPLVRCERKFVSCQYAIDKGKGCAMGKCVKYSRPTRRYESNAKRPR